MTRNRSLEQAILSAEILSFRAIVPAVDRQARSRGGGSSARFSACAIQFPLIWLVDSLRKLQYVIKRLFLSVLFIFSVENFLEGVEFRFVLLFIHHFIVLIVIV